ncbi:MAG: peptidase M16 [Candidatus Nitrohelix vancouverensis]|uniref:Peptidase M16 n=1 Tax=Candidatus Nitrohelix vancouverensis TaxID=2705534 RepID=A0A7T0G4N5_9BACT|nr:MAG: peptidase M16 [Candidatus Nitrohelix vancouverensis]
MDFELNQTYSGFKLEKKDFITELHSNALLFVHEATGAQVISLENDDDNKVFSVTFRTPPANDRGVAHILEHSVLCGSKKYPVKEPFMELMKGSLQTFLNAMTFPDKTMYPVASRNKKDFFNLMGVYLDAVLYPVLTENTFKQEGWHYELETVQEELEYKGVVFNEMKGVFSSPESLLDRHLAHSLFPDTAYGYESGGDPAAIPDLTYEEFKEFHQKYYHPSNGRFFLYGDGDTLEYLEYLQENYLKGFSKAPVNSALSPQAPFAEPRRSELEYPITNDESVKNKTFVILGYKLGLATDHEHCLAFNILSYLLMGTSASPLRKALIDSGLGSEVIGGGFDDNRLETIFAVGLKGTEKEHEEKIITLVKDVLKDLVNNGIEEDMVLSAVNSIDFKLREANFGGFSKGIVYNIQSMTSWLYEADPFMPLRYDELMTKIKQESTNGYFENLIREHFLTNNNQSRIVMTPRAGMADAMDARVKAQLQNVKSKLKPDELEQLVNDTKTLQELQVKPDSPEALATLPLLSLDDIGRESEQFPIEIKKESSPQIMFHDLFTNKIAYIQIGFNTECVPLEKIPYISLLGRMILGMGTNKRDYAAMSKHIGIHTGGVRSWHFTCSPVGDRNEIVSYLFFSGRALMEKLDDLFGILKELLGEYNFSNSKRLIDMIRSSKSDMEDSLVPHGNQYVLSRLQSYQSKLGLYNELTDGIAYYRFLEELLERVEKDPQAVAAEFLELAQSLFAKDNMLVNVTSEAEDYAKFEAGISGLQDVLPEVAAEPVKLEFPKTPVNEGFLTASSVQYVGKGANLYDLGFEFSGQWSVLKSLLGSSYLWERVRVQGGAYGSMSSFDYLTGDFNFVSYRDPNLKETLNAYDGVASYLENLEMSDDELTKIIIGCVGRLDPPLSADRKGSIAMIEHLSGKTHALKQKHRDQLLSTTLADLRNYAGLFQKVKEQGMICVLGGEEKIKQADGLFDRVEKLIK